MKLGIKWRGLSPVSFCFFSLFTLCWITGFVAQADASTTSLERRIKQEFAVPMSSLNERVVEEIKSHHHILIPGMMNEVTSLFGLYYVEVKEFLNSIDAEYTLQNLPTKTSAVVNADFLNLRLREMYARQEVKRPFSIRGHSKGGTEALLMVLRHPDLMLDGIVDRVLLEQCAIRGSSLAEPRSLSFLTPFSYFYIKNGLESVTISGARKNLDDAFQVFDERLSARFPGKGKDFVDRKREEISSKIRYIRSYQNPKEFSLATRIVQWACNRTLDVKAGPSDGLLLLKDQKDDRIGRDLGILKHDHVGLSVSLVSKTTQDERRALARAVFGEFYDASPSTQRNP